MTMSRRQALTNTARTAAEEGRWDAVAACYREREKLLEQTALAADEAEALIEVDRAVAAQVRLAQTVLASQLKDLAAIRRRLQGLRQGHGAPDSHSGMIPLRA